MKKEPFSDSAANCWVEDLSTWNLLKRENSFGTQKLYKVNVNCQSKDVVFSVRVFGSQQNTLLGKVGKQTFEPSSVKFANLGSW
jgi:hypothetical protein